MYKVKAQVQIKTKLSPLDLVFFIVPAKKHLPYYFLNGKKILERTLENNVIVCCFLSGVY